MYYIYALKQGEEVVYIGRTKNLKKRIAEHKRTKEFDYFEVIREVDSLINARDTEDHFITFFNPKYNKSLNACGKYIKLSEELKGKRYDTAKFIKLINDYNVRPIFADNYSDMTIMTIAEYCEIKGDE